MPKAFSPFTAIILAYAIGIALCLAGLALDPAEKSFVASLREVNWAIVGLGVSAMVIEIGVLRPIAWDGISAWLR